MVLNCYIPGIYNIHTPLTPRAPRSGEPKCLIPDQKIGDLKNGLADTPQTNGVNFSFSKMINKRVPLSGVCIAAEQRSSGARGQGDITN